MTEAVFPLLGSAFIILVVLPSFALLAKMALLLLERQAAGGALRALNLRYLLLTGPTLLPLAWFLSAGLHQAESGTFTAACRFDHGAMFCLEPALFVVALGSVMVLCSASALRRSRGPLAVEGAGRLRARIERVISDHPMLRGLSGRVFPTDTPGFAIAVQGWTNPRVLVGSEFAARLSDETLASALGHEGEHVRAFDPLRYFLMELALALNPIGRFLLRSHAARWYAAREAHCDREAVVRGSRPLALADAIVQAARPTHPPVALGPRDTATLRFRISMLLAFAEHRPRRCHHYELLAFPAVVSLCLLALLLPHEAGTTALDMLHAGAECLAAHLWL